MINLRGSVNLPSNFHPIVSVKIFLDDLYEMVHLCKAIKYFRGPTPGPRGANCSRDQEEASDLGHKEVAFDSVSDKV